MELKEEWNFVVNYGNYGVFVGDSVFDPKDQEFPVYIVFNSTYGVIEAETSCLMRALTTAQASDIMVQKLMSGEKTEEELKVYDQLISNWDSDEGQFH